jgi:hypothetical protein
MINNDLKVIDAMSVDNVRRLKGKKQRLFIDIFYSIVDKTSTDAYHTEYENSREKFQDYVRYFERLLQERRTLKQHCEQSEIFYDAQYQDANIVVEVCIRYFICSIDHISYF